MLKTEFFVSNGYPFQKQTTGAMDGHHEAIEEAIKKRNAFVDNHSSLGEIISEKIDFQVIPSSSLTQSYIVVIITVSYFLKK